MFIFNEYIPDRSMKKTILLPIPSRKFHRISIKLGFSVLIGNTLEARIKFFKYVKNALS